MELMFKPLFKYATFSGRARRKEYWLFTLFIAIGSFIAIFIDSMLGFSEFNLVYFIWSLAMLFPILAVGIRRLHDTGRTGWWLLLTLFPLIGGIVLTVFFCLRGEAGANRFGPDPLDPRE